MLRKIRVSLAVVFFTFLTLLFLDFTGVIHAWFGWLAKIQLVPAILAFNLFIIILLLLLTVVFGRVYCSVICPLGVMQDIFSWSRRRKTKKRYGYTKALSWLRWCVLIVFVIVMAAGFVSVAGIIEPYSAFGRIVSNLFAPFYRWGNNLLAYISGRAGGYIFYPVEVYIKSALTFGIALLTLGIVGFMAWRNGRDYCNTICPVGTLLGFVSLFSILKPVIDPGKCTKCSQCSRVCKSSCIDYKNYKIDHSRCVTCMNCLDICKFDALHYTARKPSRKISDTEVPSTVSVDGMSRRSFLSVTGLLAASGVVKAQQPVIDGGLAIIEDKKVPDRETSVVPPGSRSIRNMKRHCTACQLCVSECPENILKPSPALATFMQPEMSFERGYCRPECTRCSEVCPTGAITKIDTAEKSATQIGRAVWISDNCVVNRDDVTCTACERNCPTDAIQLVPRDPDDENSLSVPVVDTERCIGCGACEYLCPARPFSAIYVEGNQMHRTV